MTLCITDHTIDTIKIDDGPTDAKVKVRGLMALTRTLYVRGVLLTQ